MNLTDTDKDFAWVDDEDGSKMREFLDRMHTEGFKKCSMTHLPMPNHYEYAFHGPLMFFKPRP